MILPHPYRYHDAFQGQLARLEGLYPGVTTGAQSDASRQFIALEHRGATSLDIARYSRHLQHLERLIVDWVTDGCSIRVAEVEADPLADPFGELMIPEAPRSATFVAFEPSGALQMETQPKSRIDGFYVREIASQGKVMAELTFVCLEPGWQTMHLCLYSDAMEIGSRIAIAEIPIGEPVAISDLSQVVKGNATLTGDPALKRALGTAVEFLENSCSKRHCRAPVPRS